MKPICNVCAHQDNGPVWEGQPRCGKCRYEYNDGYGPFKKGAVCVHDSDLKDHFSPRVEGEGPIVSMSKLLESQSKEISSLKDENSKLRDRLTKI